MYPKLDHIKQTLAGGVSPVFRSLDIILSRFFSMTMSPCLSGDALPRALMLVT